MCCARVSFTAFIRPVLCHTPDPFFTTCVHVYDSLHCHPASNCFCFFFFFEKCSPSGMHNTILLLIHMYCFHLFGSCHCSTSSFCTLAATCTSLPLSRPCVSCNCSSELCLDTFPLPLTLVRGGEWSNRPDKCPDVDVQCDLKEHIGGVEV